MAWKDKKGQYPVNDVTVTVGYSAEHPAIDMGSTAGTGNGNQILYAVYDGTVNYIEDGWGNTYPSNKVYGNQVILDCGEGDFARYAHNLTGSLFVKQGDKVKMGAALARMGNSGYSQGNHVHFELMEQGLSRSNRIDPRDYLYAKEHQTVNLKSTGLSRIRYQAKERDPEKHQVEVIVTGIRLRAAPSLDGVIVGGVVPGIYDIFDIRDVDGYIWVKVRQDEWFATREGEWTHDLPPERHPEPDYKAALEQIFEIAKTALKT